PEAAASLRRRPSRAVTSASSMTVKWTVWETDSRRRLAMVRRTPRNGTRTVSWPGGTRAAARGPGRGGAASTRTGQPRAGAAGAGRRGSPPGGGGVGAGRPFFSERGPADAGARDRVDIDAQVARQASDGGRGKRLARLGRDAAERAADGSDHGAGVFAMGG